MLGTECEVKTLQAQIVDASLAENMEGLAMYGVLDTAGVWHDARYTACHSDVLRTPREVCRKHVAYLLTLTPQARLIVENREADIEFYRWLLGPNSPYRSITKDFNPDPEFALDYGIVIGDLDTAPTNLIYHFMIATRFVYEYNLGPIWWSFVKDGLHPAMAFMASYTPAMGGHSFNHSAFPGAVTTQWLKNFGNATPVRLEEPYLTCDYHAGADSTWGDLVRRDLATYTSGETCWDEWGKDWPEALFQKSYIYEPKLAWREPPPGPQKPIATRLLPLDRASGLTILLTEQEKLFGR
jgi:hypothetical protein